ncbi:HupE/UreJ family protein [Nannocystaceae bacterium ST9]
MRALWTALALLLALLAPTLALAHGRDTSHSRWRVEGDRVEVAIQIAARDHARFPSSQSLIERFVIEGDAGECRPLLETLDERATATGELVMRWRFDCAGVSAPRTIHVELFEALGPAHVHVLAREGSERELVLSASATKAPLDPDAEPTLAWSAFLRLGLVHMLSGWDHLAFVLALLIAAGSLRRALLLITGFTLGHSLTLALCALDLLRPHASAVELLIAASIVIVAAQDFDPERRAGVPEQVAGMLALAALLAAVRQQASALAACGAALFAWGYLHHARADTRVLLVAAFGLIHGAGFAAILHDTGLPTDARVGALLAFNLGVELGGLAFVALLWPALAWASRKRLALARPLGLLLACLGTAWVVQRAGGI